MVTIQLFLGAGVRSSHSPVGLVNLHKIQTYPKRPNTHMAITP